jgi:thiol-disulfide isomerase/thioredoxin
MSTPGPSSSGRLQRLVAAALATLLSIVLVGLSTQAFVPAPTSVEDERVHFFFWGVGCPHCEAAKPFAESLKKDYADFEHRWYEVKKDKRGRRIFKKKVRELGIERPGIPTFICHQRYVMGYTKGTTEEKVREMLDACRAEADD